MAARVCSSPGCPTLVAKGARGGRCSVHQRQADRARGSREERGYGRDHQDERAAWQKRMDAGEVIECWRCLTPVDPTDWHLGHDDRDRSITRGPEHPPCNLSAAGRVSRGGG